MRRGFVAVLVTLLLLPGGVLAFQSGAFDQMVRILDDFLSPVVVAQYTYPPAPTAFATAQLVEPASTVAETAPQQIPAADAAPVSAPFYAQLSTGTDPNASPLPSDDLVHTSVLAAVLAAFESKIDTQISTITKPPAFPQQVAAGGNGVFSYDAAAAASTVVSAAPTTFSALSGSLNLGSQVSGTLAIANGGTGLSSAPAYGQLLMGAGDGTFTLISTSSLGITGGGGGSGTVSPGTQGQFAFYNANGTTLTATSSLFLAQSGNIGIATTTPWARLSIDTSNLPGGEPEFTIGSSTRQDFIVTQNGNVGIGTSTPSSSLTVQGTALALYNSLGVWQGTISPSQATADHQLTFIMVGTTSASDTFDNWAIFQFNGSQNKVQIGHTGTDGWIEGGGSSLNFANAINSTSNPALTITGSNIGIGTTSPDMLLTVGSNVPSGSVAHFENSTGSCYINPTTTSLSCSSDARLKTNVVTLDSADGLSAVLKLNPVTYNWKTEAASTSPHTGFIAQEVQPVLPDLVSQGPDGYYTLNYAGLTPYLVKAVQEIATITGVFKDNLIAWLADAHNGITDFFAGTGHFSSKLCIGSGASETCVNQQQFAALLSQAAAANPSTSATSQASNSGSAGNGNSTTGASSTPPVISINGANPAAIPVGTTYADLGATITAPQADLNLGITVVVDNATSTDGIVQVDTSQPGTHTILYTVTDPSGLTGSATRTVIVSAPQQTPPPANDNSPAPTAANDNTAPTTTTTSTGQ